MSLRLLGFESGAASTILVLGMAIVLLLAVVVMVARRRTNAAAMAVSLAAAACSGIALASFVAVRYFAHVWLDVSKTGGGIGAIGLGIGEAAQLPLSAAWIAVAAISVAILFALTMARKEDAAGGGAQTGLLWTSALAVAGGIASVLLFRRAIDFVLAAITPGMQPDAVAAVGVREAVSGRLSLTAIAIALCFAVAIAPVIATLRLPRRDTPSHAARSVAVAALVVSLCVSSALVATLRSYSSRYLGVASHGQLSNLNR